MIFSLFFSLVTWIFLIWKDYKDKMMDTHVPIIQIKKQKSKTQMKSLLKFLR